jgi:hypothetical protein
MVAVAAITGPVAILNLYLCSRVFNFLKVYSTRYTALLR